MAGLQDLNDKLKEVYGDVIELIPTDGEVLMSKIQRARSAKVGKAYTVSANLSLDHSTTYHGTNDSALDLADTVDGQSANASIIPSAMSFSGVISKMAAERVIKGEQAFEDGVQFVINRSLLSFNKVIESTHNHGGNGIGTFTYASADASVITIDIAEWATALWIGAQRKPIDIYSISGGVIGSKVLTTSVSKVDTQTRKLTLNSVAGLSNAGTYIVFAAGAKGKESKGLFNILKQSSGSLFDIDIDENDLWGANQKDMNDAHFSWASFASAVSEFAGRGVSGDNHMLYMNTIHFPKMIPDFNTAVNGKSVSSASGSNQARWFTSGDQVMQLKHGTDSIEFMINNTSAKVVTSDYVKRGEAALVNLDTWMRVVGGDGDVSFEDFNGSRIRPLEKKAAYEYRLYTDQALFGPELNGAIYFSELNSAALSDSTP